VPPTWIRLASLNAAGESVLFTGGIGDVLALESFFPAEKRRNLRSIYYATRAAGTLRHIFDTLDDYRHVAQQTLWTDFSHFFCFFSKEEVHRRLQEAKKKPPGNWFMVQDWSIFSKFPHLQPSQFVGSSCLRQSMCQIKYHLPDRFITIVPESPNDTRDPNRKLQAAEWERIISYLVRENLHGVVVNSGTQTAPVHDRILDLSGQTTFGAAVEVLKLSQGYIGVDSSLSVLAAQRFYGNTGRLYVKSRNQHLYNYQRIYYAPHQSFGFVKHDLEL